MARTLITISLALGLALASGTEAAAAAQSARQADAIAPASTGLLARGAGSGLPGGSGEVRAIQRRLGALGFRPGPVDGRFGAQTEEAVLAFQRRHGLSVDGIVGPQTRTHLRYHGDPTRPFAGLGSGYSRPGGSELVRDVQRRLRALGFRPGPVDGRFGPRTERAVRAFQESRGLDPDGLVRGETLRQLRGKLAQAEAAAEAVTDRPGSGAQDAPRGEPTPRPAATGGSADDSGDAFVLSLPLVAALVALLVGLAVAAALATPVAARFVAGTSVLRSKGLASGPPLPVEPAQTVRGEIGPVGALVEGGEDENGRTGRRPRARPLLTERELAVLQLAAEGFTNAEIGARLYLSRHTVKEHLSHAMRKLGATNRLRAINAASSLGLLGENGLGARARGDPAAKFAYEDRGNAERAPREEISAAMREER
jgi:peptidoglycan hydrolase-like protein with peptidoglycan-binding domain/DNA-binding CsgD family transcriptional regulator